jgi:hypothetical protein
LLINGKGAVYRQARCKKSWRASPRTALDWSSKGSGHDIQIDAPEAVVNAIRKVVGQAKGAA